MTTSINTSLDRSGHRSRCRSAAASGRSLRTGRVQCSPASCSGQRAEVSSQTVGAGTRNEPVDHSMRASPDGYSVYEQRATRGRQLQPAAASIVGVDHHRDEAAPLQRLERCGQCRAVHRKQGGYRTDAGRLGLVQRHHHRVLPAGQAKRPQRFVETPRKRPRGALQVKAQAGVANLVRDSEGQFVSV
jgi:hypothetical protein